MAYTPRKQIQIWISSFDHLKKVRDAYKARGEIRAMTSIASEAILQIPVPVNGNGADLNKPEPVAPISNEVK